MNSLVRQVHFITPILIYSISCFNIPILTNKVCSYRESHDKNGEFQEAIKKALYLGGVFVFSDAIPSLEWLDIGGYIKSMKQTFKEVDKVLEGWVQERIHTKKQNNDQSVSDFMDVMLKTMQENEMVDRYTRETVIKATILVSMIFFNYIIRYRLTNLLILYSDADHDRVRKHVRDNNMGNLVAPKQSQYYNTGPRRNR